MRLVLLGTSRCCRSQSWEWHLQANNVGFRSRIISTIHCSSAIFSLISAVSSTSLILDDGQFGSAVKPYEGITISNEPKVCWCFRTFCFLYNKFWQPNVLKNLLIAFMLYNKNQNIINISQYSTIWDVMRMICTFFNFAYGINLSFTSLPTFETVAVT